MHRDEKVIWAAGFIDGEGYIGLSRGTSKKTGRPFHQALVDVSQIRRETLDVLIELFGGNIRHGKRAFYWRVGGNHARAVLWTILPYLVGKKRQAELTLQFCQTLCGEHGRRVSDEMLALREALHLQIRALNQVKVYRHAERLSEEAPAMKIVG